MKINNVKCPKCAYEWHTKSKMVFINCSSCRKAFINTTIEVLKDV